MKDSKKENLIFISILVLMIAVMLFVIVRLSSYVKTSIHNERANYLSAQTESVAGLIDSIINQYQDYSVVCKQSIGYELSEGDEISEFMDEALKKLFIADARLILIDSNCTWYGENNSWGRITSINSYTDDTADELIYITTGVDVDIESFVFRTRLDQPIKVKHNGEDAIIEYCAVIYYVDKFNQKLYEAFPYECNSFVCDEYGTMLYKNLTMGSLINGTNLLTKYERVDFLFGDNATDLLNSIKQRKATVAEMKINDNNFFICTAPLSVNNWLASFVINTEQLASGAYIDTIATYILVIGIVFSLALAIAVITSINISNNKKMLEKEQLANAYLAKASTAKSEFLSNMTHDIRTPINGILGMTALAKKEALGGKAMDCLNKIEISSNYLLSLVNDVLDMSAIENGALKINNQPLNIKELCESCVDITKTQALNRKLNITCRLNISHEYILADDLHLKQIFINILSNAVKFTPDGGSIEFRADEMKCADSLVSFLFEIKDTGEGMEQEFINNIWDRFAQSDAGARSKYKGTGLGMAITKNLVDSMGGHIDVRSKLGEGSRFIITQSFEACDPIVSTESEEAAPNISGAKILLAEDNEINMEIAKCLLEDSGAVVTPAENGKIALDIFAESSEFYFDAVLMDIMMPEMNGIESCKAIRSLDRKDARSIPIIAMTANAMPQEIENTKNAGMNAHLSKPIDIDMVLSTIASFIKEDKSNETV